MQIKKENKKPVKSLAHSVFERKACEKAFWGKAWEVATQKF